MRTLMQAGLAAALLASAAPAGAQTYGGRTYDGQNYPPSTYDRGAAGGYAPANGYSQAGAPGYGGGGYGDQGYGPRGGYGQGENNGPGAQPNGPGGADDPQELARRLNLTAGQQGAFNAYRQAFQPDQARAQQEEQEMQRMASLTTPQRLDLARASLARDRADFDRTDAATRAFYNQLSPAQRRTFDQLTAPQMDDGQDGGPDGPSPTQPAARPPR